MKDIMECYGIALLQILGGICAVTAWMALFRQSGFVSHIVVQYLQTICG